MINNISHQAFLFFSHIFLMQILFLSHPTGPRVCEANKEMDHAKATRQGRLRCRHCAGAARRHITPARTFTQWEVRTWTQPHAHKYTAATVLLEDTSHPTYSLIVPSSIEWSTYPLNWRTRFIRRCTTSSTSLLMKTEYANIIFNLR